MLLLLRRNNTVENVTTDIAHVPNVRTNALLRLCAEGKFIETLN